MAIDVHISQHACNGVGLIISVRQTLSNGVTFDVENYMIINFNYLGNRSSASIRTEYINAEHLIIVSVTDPESLQFQNEFVFKRNGKFHMECVACPDGSDHKLIMQLKRKVYNKFLQHQVSLGEHFFTPA